MTEIRNFADVRKALDPLFAFYGTTGPTGAYTLDRISALMSALGNPQNNLKIVHVAGTSGKTSTSYYAAALLQQSGVKVGLTVSPHIHEINERVQINLVPLPEVTFCRYFEEFLGLVKNSGIQPTYFECLVAFAYWVFDREKVEYAVVEVGLGGLLDGTNVSNREDKVCIITDIGFDHMQVLGNTLGEIAAQKAGIVQTHNQVFMYQQGEEVMAAVEARIAEKEAILDALLMPDILPEALQHLPLFQQRNFYLALQAVTYTLNRDEREKLTEANIYQASKVQVPGRMEVFSIGDKTVILDGAHNEQKVTALLQSVKAQFPDKPISALVACVNREDVRWERLLAALVPSLQRLIVSSFQLGSDDVPKNSMPADVVAAYAKTLTTIPVEVEVDLEKAVAGLLETKERLLLITGSLYMISVVRPLLEHAS